MPVLDAVQTFAGITNENEFYSHHYLAEVFKDDVKDRLAAWEAVEAQHPGEETSRTPPKRLQAWAQRWFALRSQVQRQNPASDRWQSFVQLQSGLLRSLGYAAGASEPELHAWVSGLPLPVWFIHGQRLAVIPAYQPGAEDKDLLDQQLTEFHFGSEPLPKQLRDQSLAEILSDAVFGAEQAPRYVILAGLDEWLLLDRYKWPNNRALRFNWVDILDRKDADTLKACAVLLHKDCLAPGEGASLLERLDERAHANAFSVSESLKYALREAIEILGNEAARQLDELASGSKKSIYSGQYKLDSGQLSLECLRLVYRLLFMFYIEARPELGYVPIQKSEVYLKGYSLESLRNLELQPLPTQQAREGAYFDLTLRRLFKLVAQGCGMNGQIALHDTTQGAKDTFSLAPLDSRLFDDRTVPLVNRVKFPNEVWQKVIRLLSLSKGKGKSRRSGRVSYQLLSINQLGAVYEALLSYRGFFAEEDLYEVKSAPKRSRAPAGDGEHADGDEDDADEESNGGDGSTHQADADMLENAWFVPRSRIEQYRDEEKVYDLTEAGHRKLRMHPKGSFIYRLAGRDRQKSASYYTPQVLTQCLVKYALKELLASERVRSADDILTLTVCEPAMGSAAFLNEGVNQLAEAYLERKQAQIKQRIPHEQYPQELQRVRMFIADRNVFGVDLNPVAVELAEVSLWLNAIYGERGEDGQPLPARVPWFGYQLFTGNSLIGARQHAYNAAALKKGAKPPWHEEPPRNVTLAEPRRIDEIWHFLLPDPGMASYTDKDAKKHYPEAFEQLKKWRKAFCAPLEMHEIARLQQLSVCVDTLWAEHTEQLARDRARTEDPLSVWPHTADATQVERVSRAQKEAIRRAGLLNEDGDLATSFRRLKLVMDYWCALWFWPITQSDRLPSREQWWMEIGAILEGNVLDLNLQAGLDLAPAEVLQVLISEPQDDMFGVPQASLAVTPTSAMLHDRLGQLRISKLRQHFPQMVLVEALADARRFMHWELCFADVLRGTGKRPGGFDLILGNPPWLKVEWNEAGILGERNPLFAIRNLSASDLAELRNEAFTEFSGLKAAWTEEMQEAEGTRNFLNAVQNYPVLAGMKANLYKCFVPLAWRLSAPYGVTGLLHPEGPYDDPRGGALREAVYVRLRKHFQFQNELQLFVGTNDHGRLRFGLHIYGPAQPIPCFEHISNLFLPSTVDACYQHSGNGLPDGIKDGDGQWNTSGHLGRIVCVDEVVLATFAKLYDAPGTPPLRARLPALHAGALTSVLNKLAAWPRRLADLGDDYFSTEMWHETAQQKDGTIIRRPSSDAGFAAKAEDWVLSGPHFFLANPFNKTANLVCVTRGQYETISLERLPHDYLPRTNYRVMTNRVDYLHRTPTVRWKEKGDTRNRPVTDYYRLVNREMVVPSNERTYISALVPPGVGHVNTVLAHVFRDERELCGATAWCHSLIADFRIKTTGMGHANSMVVGQLPIPEKWQAETVARALALRVGEKITSII
jgi:hypothetical protein